MCRKEVVQKFHLSLSLSLSLFLFLSLRACLCVRGWGGGVIRDGAQGEVTDVQDQKSWDLWDSKNDFLNENMHHMYSPAGKHSETEHILCHKTTFLMPKRSAHVLKENQNKRKNKIK